MLSKRSLFGIGFLLCLFALVPSALFSQSSSTGTVAGTVTDPSGAAVAAATVTLTDKATNIPRVASTNENGRFILVDVPAKHLLEHLKVHLTCEQGVRSCLMCLADPRDIEFLCNILQTGLDGNAADQLLRLLSQGLVIINAALGAGVFENEFDVVEAGEEFCDKVVEFGFIVGKRLADHHLHEVRKVVAGVEGDPVDVFVKDEAR